MILLPIESIGVENIIGFLSIISSAGIAILLFILQGIKAELKELKEHKDGLDQRVGALEAVQAAQTASYNAILHRLDSIDSRLLTVLEKVSDHGETIARMEGQNSGG